LSVWVGVCRLEAIVFCESHCGQVAAGHSQSLIHHALDLHFSCSQHTS